MGMINEIIHGDCLEIMLQIPAGSMDMILCDLPYGTTRSEWDTIIPFEPLWAQYERVIKENGAIVLFAKAPFDKMLGASNPKLFRYEWIWEKNKATGHLNAEHMPLQQHENILVFYKSPPTYNPRMEIGFKPINYAVSRNTSEVYGKVSDTVNRFGATDRFPKSVLHFPVVNNDDPKRIHPNQKPVELLQYFIETYTNTGDVVLDNCSGSGATAEACISCSRNFIAIEQSKQYVNKSRKRLQFVQPVMNF
jgi:DNA modification methylase